MPCFGVLPDGRDTRLFTLRGPGGLQADVTDLGGTLVRLRVPDRDGRPGDVVLGFDHAAPYLDRSPYFGCVVGRVGNRIAAGRFTLDGRRYALATNNTPGGRPCHLHGGNVGFHQRLWHAEAARTPAGEALRLTYRSPDGEEGYPGNLDVTVTYTATADHGLRLDYEAVTDAPTPVNLTNHSYFNLEDGGATPILDHELQVMATHFTPVDEGLIPTGELAPVAATPLDFSRPRRIGERIDADHPQLRFAGGYDHNFVLPGGGTPVLAATVHAPRSGRVLEVRTTEPGMQFYTGNFLDGSLTGKEGVTYGYRHGFCLETQHPPDAVNQPSFPSIILRPGVTLRSTTCFRFSTR